MYLNGSMNDNKNTNTNTAETKPSSFLSTSPESIFLTSVLILLFHLKRSLPFCYSTGSFENTKGGCSKCMCEENSTMLSSYDLQPDR
jgi:hypothetical protein